MAVAAVGLATLGLFNNVSLVTQTSSVAVRINTNVVHNFNLNIVEIPFILEQPERINILKKIIKKEQVNVVINATGKCE